MCIRDRHITVVDGVGKPVFILVIEFLQFLGAAAVSYTHLDVYKRQDETVVRGCKFRERVAVDHAVFSRADHQRARSDSDAARFVPDDVVSQYRVIFFPINIILI